MAELKIWQTALGFEHDTLVFGKKRVEPKIRTAGEMLPVLCSPEKLGDLPATAPTYFMYREAARFGSIRYDITRILAMDLGGERNKTYGHVHPDSESGVSWPEVYEVLSGSAHFMMQKMVRSGVEDAVLLSAKAGERLLIPPGYGHVTINAGKAELILANLVSDNFEADYSLLGERQGACYYEKSDGKLVRNGNYGGDFELRKMPAMKFSSEYGCFAPFEKSTLLEAAKEPKNLLFLEKPELFC